MKKSEINLAVIENFILFLTGCSDEKDPTYTTPQPYTPEELYRVAYDYIQEDHVDGEPADSDEPLDKSLAEDLTKYIKAKHNSDECTGFIDGYESAQKVIMTPKLFQLKDIHDDDVALMLSFRDDASKIVDDLQWELAQERYNNKEGYDWLEEQTIERLEELGFQRVFVTEHYIEEQ